MSSKRRWVGLLLAVAALGCALLVWRLWFPDETVTDPWYNPPPTSLFPGGHGSRVELLIVTDHRDEALQKLESSAVVPLSDAEVKYYGATSQPRDPAPPRDPTFRPFLVRALIGYEGTGRFYAYDNDGSLIVSHGSLGSFRPPPERRPLVVWLAKEPSQVFVSYNVAR